MCDYKSPSEFELHYVNEEELMMMTVSHFEPVIKTNSVSDTSCSGSSYLPAPVQLTRCTFLGPSHMEHSSIYPRRVCTSCCAELEVRDLSSILVRGYKERSARCPIAGCEQASQQQQHQICVFSTCTLHHSLSTTPSQSIVQTTSICNFNAILSIAPSHSSKECALRVTCIQMSTASSGNNRKRLRFTSTALHQHFFTTQQSTEEMSDRLPPI
ncbi:hypothetical protein PROFUN_00055 [Planoprotostelium fungivorum]|uniref:Uncharacterized protein n=1 Tax=Planoprotostelium fungivorum TaxID=1890364 RepID=A0A2P6P0I2_9EUKA|nr:hypothetical protein PROFUN_00055 [Planoprotostelium fungivorum]